MEERCPGWQTGQCNKNMKAGAFEFFASCFLHVTVVPLVPKRPILKILVFDVFTWRGRFLGKPDFPSAGPKQRSSFLTSSMPACGWLLGFFSSKWLLICGVGKLER